MEIFLIFIIAYRGTRAPQPHFASAMRSVWQATWNRQIIGAMKKFFNFFLKKTLEIILLKHIMIVRFNY